MNGAFISIINILIGVLFIIYFCFLSTIISVNLNLLFPLILGVLFIAYGLTRGLILKYSSSGFLLYVRYFFNFSISCLFISFLIILFLIITSSKKSPGDNTDAIIVLGAGLRGDKVTLSLSQRLDKAIEYYNENKDCIILVSGGQGSDELVSEASAMKKYLVDKNIDEQSILIEDRSTSTKENFLFSKYILDSYYGHKDYKVIYVTNDFHCFRAGFYANKAHFNYDSLSSDSPWFLLPTFYIREYTAIMWYFVWESWQ